MCRLAVFFGALLIVGVVVAFVVISTWAPDTLADSPPVNTTGPRAADTLKLLVVVSRHGNRKSLFSLPNDPYPVNDTSVWPYGLGQLTTHGRLQMYNLGVKIRSLYNGFLRTHYYGTDIYASSTAIDRTLLSGEVFLAGLYPPKGFQLWNRNVLWQPVPIYSSSPDKSQVIDFCPKYVQERSAAKRQFEEQYAANLSAVNGYLSQHVGANLTGATGLFIAWDMFISEDTEGLPLPAWVTHVYPQEMLRLAKLMYMAYDAGTVETIRLVAGPLFGEIIKSMEQKLNGTLSPDRQMFYYSAHDTSMIALQTMLGLTETSIDGVIKPGSAMIYELHQDPNTGAAFLQLLYIDGSSTTLDPQPLVIPECPDPCDFNLLVNLTQKFLVSNYQQECQLNTTSPLMFNKYLDSH